MLSCRAFRLANLRFHELKERVPVRTTNASRWSPVENGGAVLPSGKSSRLLYEKLKDTESLSGPEMTRLMRQLNAEEVAKMVTKRPFVLESVKPGDLVEVLYELSRSQQAIAKFKGYCIRITSGIKMGRIPVKERLSAKIVIRGVYDGVCVEQLFPVYSPRVLNIKVLEKAPESARSISGINRRPLNMNYRYRWYQYMRHRYGESHKLRPLMIRQHPGVMSLEPRLKAELATLRTKYDMLREEAGLPAYVWPGPYHVHTRQTKEVQAELQRRMLIYAWDHKKAVSQAAKDKRTKRDWGNFEYRQPRSRLQTPAATRLPTYHALVGSNSPS